MGYLLNPNTGKELTFLENLRTYYDIAFKLTCEQYTKQVLQSSKIDQTTPKRGNTLLFYAIVIILPIALIYYLLKKRKK
jgi:hypothetical protein